MEASWCRIFVIVRGLSEFQKTEKPQCCISGLNPAESKKGSYWRTAETEIVAAYPTKKPQEMVTNFDKSGHLRAAFARPVRSNKCKG